MDLQKGKGSEGLFGGAIEGRDMMYSEHGTMECQRPPSAESCFESAVAAHRKQQRASVAIEHQHAHNKAGSHVKDQRRTRRGLERRQPAAAV